MVSVAEFWSGVLDRPRVMGILNVTPDSFSDGADHARQADAVAAGHRMVEDGVDLIDIGGESTRPGSAPIAPEHEQARVIGVIAGLRDAGVPLSIDTRNASTMAAALDAGATIVNDVTALRHDPAAAALLAARRCPVILMHMRGTPATMDAFATYGSVAREVAAELAASIAHACAAGIAADQVAVDPGIGFAKIGSQNVELLRDLGPVRALGRPIVVGVSRKRFVGQVSGEPVPKRRLGGSVAAGLWAVSQGANILRVHDVAATVQALRVWQALAR